MNRKTRDADRARSAQLFGRLIGEGKAITPAQLASCMELRTSVRVGERQRYIEGYVAGTRTVTPMWAAQIGDSVPRPWCSIAWGLWCGNCFTDFVRLIEAAVERIPEGQFASISWQLSRFVRALNIACHSRAYDDLPAIVAINADRQMHMAGFSVNEILSMLEAAGCEPEQAKREFSMIVFRQCYKLELKWLNARLSTLFDRAWLAIEDPKYQRFSGDPSHRLDHGIVEQTCPGMRAGSRREADPIVDSGRRSQMSRIHLIGAYELAKSTGCGVYMRAHLIARDLRLWLGELCTVYGGDRRGSGLRLRIQPLTPKVLLG